jgi:2-polyprenyl-6-methoxyphenol hydroxylase-like FAD-dependent oxidoreductase
MNRAVVIVGAGPVGLLLACELRLHNVETLVLESRLEPSTRPYGMALNAATIELLDQREVMESIRPVGLELPQAHFAGLPLDQAKLPERHSFTLLINQSQLERRLEEHALKLGADVRRGHEFRSLEQDKEGVTVSVATPDGAYTTRCRYLVGCDGSASTVREAAGIDFPGVESPLHGIVGDLDAEPGAEHYVYLGGERCERGTFTLVPIGDGAMRIILCEFDAEPPGRDEDPTRAELETLLQRLTGLELSVGRPRWLARWYNVTRQAQQYRSGAVFLAGDAAHVSFPFNGLAFNTGLEDAMNLGWKLAADLNGRARADLLDTYHTERHPVGARAGSVTRAQVALMHPLQHIAPLREIFQELTQLAEVNEYLVMLTSGLEVRYPPEAEFAPAHPLVGRRLVNATLRAAVGETTVARLLYPGRGVLLDLSGGDRPAPDVAGWADQVDVVTAEPTDEIPAARVLLRPDGRVAWALAAEESTPANADLPDAGLHAALTTWFGAQAAGLDTAS